MAVTSNRSEPPHSPVSNPASIPHLARTHLVQPHPARPWTPGPERILVLGDAMLDIQIHGPVDRVSPEAPVPVVRQSTTRESPGGAANLAANICSLGGRAHLLSVVGADPEAARLRGLLAASGVAADLVEDPARPTTLKTRFVSGQQQLLRLDREEGAPVAAAIEDRLLARLRAALDDSIDRIALLVVSDYAKGLLTDRLLRETLALCAARRIPVFVDPKRSDLSVYRGAALLKPNRAELGRATALPVDTVPEIERAAAAAAAVTGAAILVTRAASGLSLVRAGAAPVHIPAIAREVFDVTGAGDSVMAALAVGVAAGLALEQAAAWANLAGGLAVSRHGTVQVSAVELGIERDRLLPLPGLVPSAGTAGITTTAAAGIAATATTTTATTTTADNATTTTTPGDSVPLDEAVRWRALWKRQGLVVGFTNGCFDLLHPGHVAVLDAAAAACDRLVVGLNGDASVRRLKGAGRPVQDAAARATVLAAIRHVDLVVTFEEDTPAALIAALSPDVLVKGADYDPEAIVGADTVRAAGGRVFTVELVPGHSTTRLVGRLVADHPDESRPREAGRTGEPVA
jgi:D-beta-D-heptose 7-phosphate kinase/D-beta-D-heptose 1-phosphate adenosyltransferase